MSYQHEIFVQSDAGKKAGFSNDQYIASGATILSEMREIYEIVDLVTKVKEIEESEYEMIREGQTIFACIHPASNSKEVDALIEKKAVVFTAEDSHQYGSPNCEAAGKLGALMGVYHLLSIDSQY